MDTFKCLSIAKKAEMLFDYITKQKEKLNEDRKNTQTWKNVEKAKEVINKSKDENKNGNTNKPGRISPYALACIVAVDIPDAKWAAVNFEGDMHWYEEEPESIIAGKWYTKKGPCHSETGPYRVPCNVENWKEAKWRIR